MIDTPVAADPAAVREFRAILVRAGFDPTGIPQALGLDGTFTRDPLDIPYYLRRLRRGSPVATLATLFVFDSDVPVEEAEVAFEPLGVEGVRRLGVVTEADGRVRASVNIYPMASLLLSSDLWHHDLARPDHVLGTSISARVLLALTVRRPVDSALDVGTGCGVQALHAAAHARRVVATDVNPRAVKFAEFNAVLNGLDNVETRVGNAFEPVEGETFDLVVTNPPYVISPESAYAYRDSGLPGDTFSEGLVRRAPEFLNDGGFATVLCEWAHAPDEDWSLPLRRWIAGSGCDALLIYHMSQDPLAYAATWNNELRRNPEAFGSALDRWVAYDRELGIERIGWGAVVLRRRSGENWVRTIETSWASIVDAGDHIERIFRAHDFLATLGPERGLLDAVFVLPPAHRFAQSFVADGAGEGQLEGTTLSLAVGLGAEARVEQTTLRVLTLLDGRRALGDVLVEAAAGSGAPFEELAPLVLPGLVQLLEVGLLEAR